MNKRFSVWVVLGVFLLVAASFLFVGIFIVSYDQKVYFADASFPKIVAKMKEESPEASDEVIVNTLKEKLPKVTPDFAEKKFNIKWMDNSIPRRIIMAIHIGEIGTKDTKAKPPLVCLKMTSARFVFQNHKRKVKAEGH